MTSSIHEGKINDKLAEVYAKHKQNGLNDKAAGIILAAEAIGNLGAVSGEIVADTANRDYMCEHPTEKLEKSGSNIYCANCEAQIDNYELLNRLKEVEE